MAELIRSSEIEAEKFIDLLSDEEIVVYEDVQASKIWVNYVNNNWIIRPKAVINNPINLVDMAMQKYYKWAYAYLLSLPENVTKLLRPHYYFCFEYFPDEQPANVKYDRVPKNHLILSCICKYGKHYSYDMDELKVYAELFGVEAMPILYKGRLGDKQIKALTYFIYTSKRDLELFFSETNFAEFFYKMLNPFAKTSYLKNSGYQNNLEKIIIRFLKSNTETTLEILNPMYQKMNLKTDSEFSDVYSILLFNFMQWLMNVELDEIEVAGTTRELVYINLMSKLYAMYIGKYEKSIENFVFTVPSFFNRDKFRINQELIANKTVLDYINKSTKLEYVFKIILASFQRERKKPIGIINDIALEHLNKMVVAIQDKVDMQFNLNSQLNRHTYQLQNLDKFPNLKWEEDAKGYVYPEIGSLFDTDGGSDKKKKFDDKKK
jgi:hypothetical protein